MLGIAIGDILPAAVAVAVSPLNIAAAILMPLGPRAARNGPAFLVGWVVGLALVGVAALAGGERARPPCEEPSGG